MARTPHFRKSANTQKKLVSKAGAVEPKFVSKGAAAGPNPSATFRAVVYARASGEGIDVVEKPCHAAGSSPVAGVIRVDVKACGVNPVDAKYCVGDKLPEWLPEGLRRWTVDGGGVGFDFSGIVSAVPSEDSCGFSVGDRVFGSMPPLQASFAEIAEVPAHQLAVMPSTIDFTAAAALPLVSTTAMQALRHRHGLRAGQRILIIGASGGVGSIAVQLAKHIVGASGHVAAICSGRNHALVRGLGADALFDYTLGLDALFAGLVTQYTSRRSAGSLEQFDLVFDCVSSLEAKDYAFDYCPRMHASGLLKAKLNASETSRSNYITIGGAAGDWLRAGLRRSWFGLNWFTADHELFWVEFPNSRSVLEEVAEAVDAGALRPLIEPVPVKRFISVEPVRTAFSRLHSRRVRGKLVLVL